MNCCIINPKKAGCYSTCDTLKTGLTAGISGEYTLNCFFAGFWQPIKKTFTAGQVLDFELAGLNEKAVYYAEVINPTGTVVNLPTFDGFSFKTVLQTTKGLVTQPISNEVTMSTLIINTAVRHFESSHFDLNFS
jgi:hypothetical protein